MLVKKLTREVRYKNIETRYTYQFINYQTVIYKLIKHANIIHTVHFLSAINKPISDGYHLSLLSE